MRRQSSHDPVIDVSTPPRVTGSAIVKAAAWPSALRAAVAALVIPFVLAPSPAAAQADDDLLVARLTEELRTEVQRLVKEALSIRQGVFA